MANHEKPKEYPVGLGEEFQKERRKETLPAVEIKNVVIWINPAFKDTVPLKIKEGKSTNLGIFFKPSWYEQKERESEHKLTVAPEIKFGRSGLIGSIVFQDKDDRMYRDVDLKGVGLFEKFLPHDYYVVAPVRHLGEIKEIAGILDYEDAVQDASYAEEFLKAGIRTHRAIALIDLHEIVDGNGKKISIEEAKKRGILDPDSRPVIEVRAFGTRERMVYVRQNFSAERALTALRDAKTLVAQELDKTTFTWMNYLEWFSKTLGQQVARIRKLGMYHGNLSMQNITLDCRIVDLDTVMSVKEMVAEKTSPFSNDEDAYDRDCEAASDSLYDFLDLNLLGDKPIYMTKDRMYFIKIFKDAYQKELESK